jgi:hypothetical protein
MEDDGKPLTINLIDKHFSKITDSSLWNPIYGKSIFFFEECVKPSLARNQLLGYLGAFSNSSPELNREFDICVIPYASCKALKNGGSDEITKAISKKLKSYNKKSDSYTNTIPNTLIISEYHFFQFIKDNLLQDDQVKIDQFNQIDFTFKF